MDTLQLLVPGLLGPMPGLSGCADTASIDRLLRHLARADRAEAPGRNLEQSLFALFGQQGGLGPVAAGRRLGDGGEPDDGVWLQVNPVLLKPDQDRLLLFDAEEFSLDTGEARELADLVCRHFSDLDWKIEVALPHRWYLRLTEDPGIRCYSLGDVFGRNLFPFLPRGEQASRWRSLINEIQMLLHASDLNQARERRGEAPVNGLWFSGEGSLSDLEWVGAPPDRVYADDALARGLARIREVDCRPLAEFTPDEPLPTGRTLVLWPDLERWVWRADPEAWLMALGRFAGWFQQLLKSFGGGQRIELYPCNGGVYRFCRSQRWRWWRRSPALGQLLDQNLPPQ